MVVVIYVTRRGKMIHFLSQRTSLLDMNQHTSLLDMNQHNIAPMIFSKNEFPFLNEP